MKLQVLTKSLNFYSKSFTWRNFPIFPKALSIHTNVPSIFFMFLNVLLMGWFSKYSLLTYWADCWKYHCRIRSYKQYCIAGKVLSCKRSLIPEQPSRCLLQLERWNKKINESWKKNVLKFPSQIILQCEISATKKNYFRFGHRCNPELFVVRLVDVRLSYLPVA